MEFYFNPYPAPAESIDDAKCCAVRTANALTRLMKETSDIKIMAEACAKPGGFVVHRQCGADYDLGSIIWAADGRDQDSLRLLLRILTNGQIFEITDEPEQWVAAETHVSVPVLTYAAKQCAAALTIPTSPGWDTDCIAFENRNEILHNLWGQEDLTSLNNHCVQAISNAVERFRVKYSAEYCVGALAEAPDEHRWEQYGFFISMNRAHNRQYEVDNNILKSVGNTSKGKLLELRCCNNSGWRIFFVHYNQKLHIGGFYSKNGGVSQDSAIQTACKRINKITAT